ncbi:hypothetical protein LRAMOSA05116 [Lichtheimia ramosa]|uniref:Uncharacterized protein n=1 Tax=Lichtheimia ramosa TaxID=688394 RepID=A0A077X1K1_9FUNG|nr:hypothetical protein LRAMOSA05116 [Lichtheimia ramosa]
MNELQLKPYEQPIEASFDTPLQVSTLIMIQGRTSQQTKSQYDFLSKRQGTAFAVLPVHTDDEHKLFKSLLAQHFPDHLTKGVDFAMFARIWSRHDDRINIHYKTPEYLRSQYTMWKDSNNAAITRTNNERTVTSIDQLVQSTRRKRVAPPAHHPRPQKLPRPIQLQAMPIVLPPQLTSIQHADPTLPPHLQLPSPSIAAPTLGHVIPNDTHLAPKPIPTNTPSLSSSNIETNNTPQTTTKNILDDITKLGRRCGKCFRYECKGRGGRGRCENIGKDR